MLAAVDHVQLAAPPGSEPQLRTYYEEVLGMTEIPKPPVLAARGGCWFQYGPVQLHVGIEEDFRPARKAHPGLRVIAIEAYARRLRGTRRAGRLGRQPPGTPAVLLRGPGGQPAGVPGAGGAG